MGSWLIKLSISLRKRAGTTRGALANTATAVSAGTNCRWRNGISSPTGTPLRVTTKDWPLSSARMIRPLSLRSSRCVMRRLMPAYCSTCATARPRVTAWVTYRRASMSRVYQLPARCVLRAAAAAQHDRRPAALHVRERQWRPRRAHPNGTLGDAIRERRPVDQFHHERWRACGVLNAVNVRNGRMIERGEQVRLTLGPREPLRVVGECVGQDFERDVAPEFGVPRAIDLPHSAAAQQRDDS